MNIFNLLSGSRHQMCIYVYDLLRGSRHLIFSSPCQRQCELLPSLGVRRPSSVVR